MIKLVTMYTQNALGQVLLVCSSELSLPVLELRNLRAYEGLSIPELKVSQVIKTRMEQCQRWSLSKGYKFCVDERLGGKYSKFLVNGLPSQTAS